MGIPEMTFILLAIIGTCSLIFGIGGWLVDRRDEENELQNWWAQQDQDDEWINQP